MTGALLFLVGVVVGIVANAFWDDLMELLDLYREERER